jgi:hypothetical protein
MFKLGRERDARKRWLIFLRNHREIWEYLGYYHEDRIHDSLDKDTPATRLIERRSVA